MESVKVMSEQVLNNHYRLDRIVEGVRNAYAAPGFWLKDTKRACALLMTEAEIQRYNRRMLEQTNSPLADLTNPKDHILADQVRGWITAYQFGTYQYLSGTFFSSEQKELMVQRCNLDGLRSGMDIPVSYGLVALAANVRGYPTEDSLMESSDDWEFDYFQETTLKIGEGVCIYHTTRDGKWLFVQSQNYRGWVQSSNIAQCTREEMITYLTAEDFVVLTDQAKVERGESTLYLAMGCMFPKGKQENRAQIPVSENGKLKLEELSLEQLEHSDGYLPYTTALVLDQAMKLLNTTYGWGGKNNLLDCSSTMLSVYSCFGFSLPRNTGQLADCQEHAIDISHMSECEKRQKLKEVLPGSMLLMKGHVMMYLGIREDTVYALHAFTNYYDSYGNKERIMQCTITPLNIKKADGLTYLEAVHTVLEVRHV